MIKKCKNCGKSQEMKSNQLYCDAKCKKSWENSQRGGKILNFPETHSIPTSALTKPPYLDEEAAKYWDWEK